MSPAQCEVFVNLIGLPLATSPVTPAGFTPGIVQLLEADGSVSDQIALRRIPITGRYSVYFISDGAGPVLQAGFDLFAIGLNVLGTIPETGLWQDISGFFNVAAGHIYVQSDRSTGAGVACPARVCPPRVCGYPAS